MNRQFIIMLFLGALAAPTQTGYVSNTQGLTEADLVQAVLSGDRDLQAARQQLRQAQARLVQAGLWPNPTLDASYSTERFTENKGAGGYSGVLNRFGDHGLEPCCKLLPAAASGAR